MTSSTKQKTPSDHASEEKKFQEKKEMQS